MMWRRSFRHLLTLRTLKVFRLLNSLTCLIFCLNELKLKAFRSQVRQMAASGRSRRGGRKIREKLEKILLADDDDLDTGSLFERVPSLVSRAAFRLR